MIHRAPAAVLLTSIQVSIQVSILVWAAPAIGQDWRGAGRANGVVQTLAGDPIAGARVLVRPVALPNDGPGEVATDAEGRWSIMGLAAGRWEINVQAPGYIDSDGWFEVSESMPNFPVKVRLRPLDEVSPAFSNGNPATLEGWIDKGNLLLGQGRYVEAREEYTKALGQLPEDARPEVLRAVARTWFMEGDVGSTLRALRQALYWNPADADTRKLYVGVSAELGREREAEELLATLDREGREALDETEIFDEGERPSLGRLPPEIASLPVLPAEAGRRGRYRVRFSDRSPLSEIDALVSRLGMTQGELEEVDPAAGRYELGEESFHVFAPELGDSRDETGGPWGLFVWISPTAFGGFVSEDMRRMLERHRLIWIGADGAGNPRMPWYRFALALDAVANMMELYEIDERRIFASGYSGGGRVTSGLAMLWPEIFAGGFSIYGCDYFRRVRLPDKPGAYWPARLPEPDRATLSKLQEERRFVLLTGELDFNRAQTLATWEQMEEDGFLHATYLDVPGASHYTRVPLEWLEKGVRALDGSPSSGVSD